MRQHDLRVPHNCTSGSCPAPLVKVTHDLSTIALSPLTPYQFVVAGESPYVSNVIHFLERRTDRTRRRATYLIGDMRVGSSKKSGACPRAWTMSRHA